MKEPLYFLDKDDKTLGEIVREGIYSQTLLSNPAFESAVRDVYYYYVETEDLETASSTPESAAKREHYSLRRLALQDLIQMLDGKILAGENAQYTLDNEGL